jgi:hypothetical protein
MILMDDIRLHDRAEASKQGTFKFHLPHIATPPNPRKCPIHEKYMFTISVAFNVPLTGLWVLPMMHALD